MDAPMLPDTRSAVVSENMHRAPAATRRTAIRRTPAHSLIVVLLTMFAVPSCGGGEEARIAAASDGSLVSPYLAIGEVLADDSVAGLPELAAKLVEAGQARAEEAGVDALSSAAGRIASPDIATARLMYKKMSDGFIAWLGTHPDERAGLVLVHCPMTFNDEGAYWVQREGKILNPYEGSMMLHCGAKLDWSEYREGGPPSGKVEVEGMPAP